MKTTKTGRAAIIEDDVQRGLGMLPQQAICEDLTGGKIEKMRLRGPVDTACQFVLQIDFVRIWDYTVK